MHAGLATVCWDCGAEGALTANVFLELDPGSRQIVVGDIRSLTCGACGAQWEKATDGLGEALKRLKALLDAIEDGDDDDA